MKILREPLLHFAALGVVLFLVYTFVSERRATDAERQVTISAPQIELLATMWERRWQRPPTEDELRGLVDARVREEILYREALAVGLDENDGVVRRRMVQKMELLSEDLALLADPTEQELESFFQARAEEYRFPPRLSFSHVYFNQDGREEETESAARRVLAELRAESPVPRHAAERGDRFMLGYDFTGLSPDEVRREFGDRFTVALFELGPGWQGPVESGFGLHLVYVGEREAERAPQLAEIRPRLVVDFDRDRRERSRKALYEGLSAGYRVSIDEETVERLALNGN